MAALNTGAVFGGCPGWVASNRQTRAITHTPSYGWKLNVQSLASAEISHLEIAQRIDKYVAVEVTERISFAAQELVLIKA